MSPRGVAITGLREQLFSAAERLLVREGPQAVSGRAITREAGFATGLLYNHFGDIEEFLTELVVHRFGVQAEYAAALPDRAGSGEVTETLVEVGLTLLRSDALAIANLVLTRPALRARVAQVMESGIPGFPEVTTSVAEYLEREKELGRVTASTDSHAIALALVGTVHHLLLTRAADAPAPEDVVRRLVLALAEGIIPASNRTG